MSDWYDALAAGYAQRSTADDGDIPFYTALALEADGPLVELAVGTGRVAIPIAKATGKRVFGIDSSRGCSRMRASGQPQRESISTCARATSASSSSRSRRP